MPGGSKSHDYIAFLDGVLKTMAFTSFSQSAAFNLPVVLSRDRSMSADKRKKAVGRLRRAWEELAGEVSPDHYSRILLEILLCRLVESFDHYVSRMLTRVFVEKHETLKTSEQVTMREVLECADIATFVARRAEKKVHELSYMGLERLMQYLNKDLGLDFDTSGKVFRAVSEVIEVRNIIVHNGGRVNAVFLQRAKRNDLTNDELFPLTFEYVLEGLTNLRNLAEELDEAFTGHFGLPPKKRAQ